MRQISATSAKNDVLALNKVKKDQKRAYITLKGTKTSVLGSKIPIFCGIFFDRVGGTPLPPFVDNIFDEKLLADLGGNHPPPPFVDNILYQNLWFVTLKNFERTFTKIGRIGKLKTETSATWCR